MHQQLTISMTDIALTSHISLLQPAQTTINIAVMLKPGKRHKQNSTPRIRASQGTCSQPKQHAIKSQTQSQYKKQLTQNRWRAYLVKRLSNHGDLISLVGGLSKALEGGGFHDSLTEGHHRVSHLHLHLSIQLSQVLQAQASQSHPVVC